MEVISIYNRTTRTTGDVKVRFRLVDGRQVALFHVSEIKADIAMLQKLNSDGSPKRRAIVPPELVDRIADEMDLMRKVYKGMCERGLVKTSDNFNRLIDEAKRPEAVAISERPATLIERFQKYIDQRKSNGIRAAGTLAHDEVLSRILWRFLRIGRKLDMTPKEVISDDIWKFREFLRDEYKYVALHKSIYSKIDQRIVPHEPRGANTVSVQMKRLRSFFNALVDSSEIDRNPFSGLMKEQKDVVVHTDYDEAVFLTKDELRRVMSAEVPDRLVETRDAFVLQCALGCRVGDFSNLCDANMEVSEDGIPYVHYRPQKTSHTAKHNDEVETPLMLYALEIVKRYHFHFKVLKYVTGKSGYNVKIKELMRICEIDTRFPVFNEEQNVNVMTPLHELASSKLARKTHINLMKAVQIDEYAARLHKEGSDAVRNYENKTIKDRFILMCAAFGEQPYRVGKDFDVLPWETEQEKHVEEDLQAENARLRAEIEELKRMVGRGDA